MDRYTSEQLSQYESEKTRKEMIEHQDVLLSIRAIIKTEEGRKFFKYVFKELGVTEVPPAEMDGKILFEYLGHLRAGNSIYKLVCEAASEAGAQIIAAIERERYEDKLEQFRIEHGLNGYSIPGERSGDGQNDE